MGISILASLRSLLESRSQALLALPAPRRLRPLPEVLWREIPGGVTHRLREGDQAS